MGPEEPTTSAQTRIVAKDSRQGIAIRPYQSARDQDNISTWWAIKVAIAERIHSEKTNSPANRSDFCRPKTYTAHRTFDPPWKSLYISRKHNDNHGHPAKSHNHHRHQTTKIRVGKEKSKSLEPNILGKQSQYMDGRISRAIALATPPICISQTPRQSRRNTRVSHKFFSSTTPRIYEPYQEYSRMASLKSI
jgi:hypothetical protein